MTQISLEPLGLLEVADSDVYEFPGGLPGFTHVRRFALVRPPEFAPLGWLAALDEPGLAFVVVDPLVFFDRYQPRLAPEDLEVLGLRDQGRATILTILNIPDDPSLTTANLRGPVALNPESRTGRQAILAGQDYLTRHPITEGQGGRDPVARTHPQAQSEHHHR